MIMDLGFIGTGVMGQSMVGHLLAAGHQVAVYNRTKSKTDSLIEKGATWYDTPTDVAAHSEVVFTMVGYPSDVEEVYFGDKGIFRWSEEIKRRTNAYSLCLKSWGKVINYRADQAKVSIPRWPIKS